MVSSSAEKQRCNPTQASLTNTEIHQHKKKEGPGYVLGSGEDGDGAKCKHQQS
jgi:hypothetical protein